MRAVAALMAFCVVTGAANAQPVAPPAPAFVPTPADTLNLDLSTGGRVVIALRPDKAPLHVERIRTLTRAGFYDGLVFHRVIEGFMAQTGDPKGTGEGGSPLPDVKAEFTDLPHVRGAVSAARPESVDGANSQFFIVFLPVLRLDGRYSVFGRVTQGMQYVDAIERGEPPANPSKIVKAWIEADGPNAPRVALPAAPPPAMIAPAPVEAPVAAQTPPTQ